MAAKYNLPDDEFRNIYVKLMSEIKLRMECIDQVIKKQLPIRKKIAFELCYLQLRLICELIALACLAVHGNITRLANNQLLRNYNANKIIKELGQLHPRFYPQPGKQILDEQTGRPVRVDSIEIGSSSETGLKIRLGLVNLQSLKGDFEGRAAQEELRSLSGI